MTAHHCPGCRGYTHGWGSECPGIGTGSALDDNEIRLVDAVPPLRLADRLRVLIGLPVLLGLREGPLGEPFETLPAGDLTRWETEGHWRE